MSTPDTLDLRIESIRRGPRVRKDYGGLEKLIESIRTIGLLQPIGVDPDKRLIFGERRVRAFEALGYKTIPARVIAIDDLLDGEYAENMVRKDFTVSERVAIGQAMAERLGDRRRFNADGGPRTDEAIQEKFPESKRIQTRDLAAEHAGFGNGKTYEEARHVVEKGVQELVKLMDDEAVSISAAARLAEYPEQVQRCAADKIREGEKPTEALRQIKSEQILKEVSAPTAKYRILYVDPPWRYSNTQPDYHTDPRDHYPTTPMDELCAIPVGDWYEPNAALFIWVTSPILEESFNLVNAWGFKYKTSFVWDKVRHNMGHYNSVRHEFLLVCVRGSCMPEVPKLFDSVITEERREHSKKPAMVYEMIETLYPHGKRLELFARGKREGWDAWGNEVAPAL